MFSTGARRPPGGPVEFDHPSRTYRGDGRCGSHTLHRSKLIRYPDAPRNRSTRASPRGTGFGTGFSHTVEFSRNVAGLLFGDSLAVPASTSRRRSAGTVPRAFRGRQRLPTCPESVLLPEYRPPRRHVTQKRRPVARFTWASGRPPNSRWIDSDWCSATSCLPLPTPLASSRRGPRS
jgi:hypothetical protein